MRLIDADELIKMLQDTIDFNRKHNTFFKSFSMQHMLYILENMKTIAPVKHGHWIFAEDMVSYIKCSECGDNICWVNTKRPKYCPSCGSRMDGDNK